MSDFYPLVEPQLDDYLKLWFVIAERKSNDTAQILNTRSEVVRLGLHSECIYFNTEAHAHKAAYIYYSHHLVHYPYTAKWIKCSDNQPIVTATQTIESQVMRFK